MSTYPNAKADFRPTTFAAPMCAALTKIAALPAQEDRNAAYTQLLADVSRNTRERFCTLAAEAGLRTTDLYHRYGIPYSFLGKMFSGQKTVSTNILADVCNTMLGISANELVFGEPCRIVVPNALNAVILLAEEDPDPARKEAFCRILKHYAGWARPVRGAEPIQKELVHERVREIAGETGVALSAAAKQNDWGEGLRMRFQVCQEMLEQPVPSVKRLAGYCFRWQKPIDYFISRDYTLHSQLFYRDGDSLLLLRGDYRTLVSVYLRLLPQKREQMIAELLALELAA